MPKDTRRSGLSLALVGLLGVAFFWLTDPRFDVGSRWHPEIVDAMHNATAGTWVGTAGAILVMLIGLWLMTRRTT